MTESRFHSDWIPLQDKFYRVALHILEDGPQAEDVVQDLYVKLWEMGDLLDAVKSPAAYGILLTRNLCIDRLRRSAPRAMIAPPIDDEVPGPEEELIAKELYQEVLAAIESLPPGQKTVVRQRIFEGRSNGEIAAATGMSELSVRVQMSLARNKIRKSYEKHR